MLNANSRLDKAFARLVAASLLASMPALTLAAPDAGALLQQLEMQAAPAFKSPSLATPVVPTPPAEAPAGPVVLVKAFRIEGATLLSPAVLQSALAGFTHRQLSLTQLKEAAWVVAQTYRQAGWLVNALVPQQEIDDGQVLIQVVEARLGQIHVQVQADVRIEAARIQDMVQAQVQTGQPLSLAGVDKALMLIGELAGVVASGSFAPSQADGATDLVVLVGAAKRLQGSFSMDNYGARSTGASRLTANLTLNSLLGMGDSLGLNLVNTKGSHYGRAAFSMPLGVQGLRVGVHGSDMTYEFSWNSVPISGTARTWGGDLSGPVMRTPAQSWSWSLATDQKHLQNQASGAITSDYRIDVARASLNGSWQSRWLGTAQNGLSLSATSGQVNNPADTTGADGRFNKFNLAFNREHAFNGSLSWYVQAQTQSASRNLDSSEKLYLGGPMGVRAYPANEVGGATGHTVTTGLRQRLGQGWTVSGFADWGRVSVCRNQLQVCLRNGEPSAQSLQGYGATLQWQTEPGVDLSLTWSHRDGRNPLANTAGLDSDQTRVINRLWLSAAVHF